MIKKWGGICFLFIIFLLTLIVFISGRDTGLTESVHKILYVIGFVDLSLQLYILSVKA